MEEFQDGSFGEINDSKILLKKLTEDIPKNIKSIHFGTRAQLEAIKKKAEANSKIEARLCNLEDVMNEISISRRGFIQLPTERQVELMRLRL